MGWINQNDKKKERECNCCIEIEDSICVIICGEIEVERLRSCLQTALDVKNDAADKE